MTEQAWFNLYVIVVVSIIAQSLLAWELGSKGVQGLIRSGTNPKVILAFLLFLIQGIWQRLSSLEFPLRSFRDMWPLFICVGVFIIARVRRSPIS